MPRTGRRRAERVGRSLPPSRRGNLDLSRPGRRDEREPPLVDKPRASTTQSTGLATHQSEAILEAERIEAELELLFKQDALEAMLPLAERALALREGASDHDNLGMVSTIYCLAQLRRWGGALDEAERFFLRALAIIEKEQGPEHPDLVDPLEQLAGVYREQNAHAKAESTLLRILALAEQGLGPNHTDLIEVLEMLSNQRAALGRYAESVATERRAFAIAEQAYGLKHEVTIGTLFNLSISFFHLYLVDRAPSDYEKAVELFERLLTALDGRPADHHLNPFRCLDCLAEVHQARGAHALVESTFLRQLAHAERSGGPNHPDVAVALDSLALHYQTQGEHAKAGPLRRRASSIREGAPPPS